VPANDAEPFADLVEQPEGVPIQPIGEPHGLVRETMQLFQLELPMGKTSEDCATAFSAQVEGQIVTHD
jgi:hypothetical protein